MGSVKTPIYNFIKEYSDSGKIRLHTPGHKGQAEGIGSMAALDLTEIDGADSLFEASGIIAESEKIATSLFGSYSTFYSAGGSTLSIYAMLSTIVRTSGKKIIAARNSHRSFISAAALLDILPIWIYPDYEEGSAIGGCISKAAVMSALKANPDANAVYITSPDYLGAMSDIRGIAKICANAGIPLIVDNAHGSHLKFSKPDLHPISIGATMCCDSAHKTLPVLTGGGYLHVADNEFGREYAEHIKENMALFGSTSPSYLIMASLDKCNSYLNRQVSADIERVTEQVIDIKNKLHRLGYIVLKGDQMRISLSAVERGYTGIEFAHELREKGIECEYADENYAVLLFSPVSSDDDIKIVHEALISIKAKVPIPFADFSVGIYPDSKMSIRQALFSKREKVAVDNALDRICAEIKISCPPGVPIVAPGEVITAKCIKVLKRYGILELYVVK
ncbi:MAG: amino acid decarboxylase [Clostridiales bacterium]|nr:amino acid decarboxylase [Clostridiales bacterium]